MNPIIEEHRGVKLIYGLDAATANGKKHNEATFYGTAQIETTDPKQDLSSFNFKHIVSWYPHWDGFQKKTFLNVTFKKKEGYLDEIDEILIFNN
jgi:hypothetical protein